MPMELIINNKPVKIYVNPVLVKPYYKSAEDYKFAEGIVIERNGSIVELRLPAARPVRHPRHRHPRHRRTMHKPMEELTVSSAASAASPINHLASWIKEKSGTFISTIFNSIDQGIAKAAERFYASPTLEGSNNPRDAETNPVKSQYNNGHLADNVYLAKWLFGMVGNHAVVDRMNQAEQTLANNNDSISSLEGSKKQLRQGIATYGSEEEKTAFNAFEEKRMAVSPATTSSEKWMDRKNTTSAFFRSLPAPLCVANDSSLGRPSLIKREPER